MKKIIFATACLFYSMSLFAIGKYYDLETGLDQSHNLNMPAALLFPGEYNKKIFPILSKEIKEIAADRDFMCALDETKATCWTSHEGYWKTIKNVFTIPLINPRNLVINRYRACAIDEEGVKCWTHYEPGFRLLKDFKDPEIITLSSATNLCALSNNEVRCERGDYSPGTQSGFVKPSQLVSGYHHACVLDLTGLKCWSKKGPMKNPEGLKNVREVQASYDSTCVIDDEGLKCWGKKALKQEVKNNDAHNIMMAGGKVCFEQKSSKNVVCSLLLTTGIHFWSNRFDTVSYRREGKKHLFEDRKCVLNKEGIFCIDDNVDMKVDDESLFIPVNQKNVDDIVFNTNSTCVSYLNKEVKCWATGNMDSKSTQKSPGLFSIGNGTCYFENHNLVCWTNEYLPFTDYKLPQLNLKNPRKLYGYLSPVDLKTQNFSADLAILDDNGITQLKTATYKDAPSKIGENVVRHFEINTGNYFYAEKAVPLTYANEILKNVEDSDLNICSLEYFRDFITKKFAEGLTSDTSKMIASNMDFLMELNLMMSSLKKDSKFLSQRNPTQLRFILDVLAKSLTSSKYLLSNDGKSSIDRVLPSFLQVLSEDEVSVESASEVMNHLYEETSLLNEMNKSYRLVGNKAFYDWADIYIKTGKIE